MRIKVTFVPQKFPASFPLDNHPLSSLIYSIIGGVDPEYAEFLHEDGYAVRPELEPPRIAGSVGKGSLKRFRFFVYSRLFLPGAYIEDGRLWCKPGTVEWQIASPIPELMEALVMGLGGAGSVTIGDRDGVTEMEVAEIAMVEPPRFVRRMRFTLLSPITVSMEERGPQGERRKHYLRADEPEFGSLVAENLREKYRALTGAEPPDASLEFDFDWDYIRRRGGPERVSKLVSYKGTRIKAYLAPFTVRGSEELIALGWESGFGVANAQGFGMARG